MNAGEAEIAALLLNLEQALLDPSVRRDSNRVLALLAEGFVEFGASGRAWTRGQIVDLLATEAYEPPSIEDFSCRVIAPGAALATYRAVRGNPAAGSATATLRSSIWIHEDGRWQMVFHQGTNTA